MTPAQVRAVGLAAQGMSSRQIAQQMRTTENSIRQTLHRVYLQIGLQAEERKRPDPRALAAALSIAAEYATAKRK